jgi:hypothetical protein
MPSPQLVRQLDGLDMARIVVIGLMAAMFSTFALGQNRPPSPESQVIKKKMKAQQSPTDVSAQCLPGQKQCNGLGGHGANMWACCKANDTCGHSFDGIPYCK